MKTNHCFYCIRPLNRLCPLQGAEYLLKKQTKTAEDKLIHTCLLEVLTRHLKNAPPDYICAGGENCLNLQQMLQKVIQEKEEKKELTYRRLHLLDETKNLEELESQLPPLHLIPKENNHWKLKVSDNCFIIFRWHDGNAYEVDVVDKDGKEPVWLDWVVEQLK